VEGDRGLLNPYLSPLATVKEEPVQKHARILALFAAGAIVSVAAWPIILVAFTPEPVPPGRFGMVGLAFGQTARLNAVNLLLPDPAYPPQPCRVTLGFVDARGETFVNRDGTEIVKEVRLMPGHAAFLDMPGGQALVDSRRVQFRAGLEFPAEGQPPDPCRDIVATLEVVDNLSGRTMVLYQPPDSLIPGGTEVAR
jgi:hypothetical protein